MTLKIPLGRLGNVVRGRENQSSITIAKKRGQNIVLFSLFPSVGHIEPWGFVGKHWTSRLWYISGKSKVEYSKETFLDLL